MHVFVGGVVAAALTLTGSFVVFSYSRASELNSVYVYSDRIGVGQPIRLWFSADGPIICQQKLEPRLIFGTSFCCSYLEKSWNLIHTNLRLAKNKMRELIWPYFGVSFLVGFVLIDYRWANIVFVVERRRRRRMMRFFLPRFWIGRWWPASSCSS